MHSFQPKILFLDLEETIIDSWSEGMLLVSNAERIADFIEHEKFDEVHIFSYAIWNPEDVTEFNARFRAPLENSLRSTFVAKVLTTSDIHKVVCKEMRAQFDLIDFLSLWGKKRGFEEFICATYSCGEFVLIDDVVPNRVTVDFDVRGNPIRKITLKNITSL